MTTKYFQIGGFKPNVRWFHDDWDDKKLVETLAGPSSPLRPSVEQPLELVLGIKATGSSHLLLADIQAAGFERAGRQRPYGFTTVADYVSVSPIYFASASDLEKKLSSLKPKARKKREGAWDSSQANKSYANGNDGFLRGEFEHGRVLYYLLQEPQKNPAIYSISDTTWTQNLRILSFTCNRKTFDGREYAEKQRSPRPLDYGWAEGVSLQSGIRVQQGSAVHFVREEERLLKVSDRKQVTFDYGTTKTIRSEEIDSLARDFFGDLSEKSGGPVILLVHNEKLARSALQELGIETSRWKSGIAELLRPQPAVGSRAKSTWSPPQYMNDYEERKQRSRNRSQSPKSGPSDHITRESRRSPPATSHTKSTNGVYIVDVQTLYRSTMQITEEYIGGIAQKLGLLKDRNQWCAGNEAVYIFHVWYSLISGPAIDEYRAMVMNAKEHEASPKPQAPEQRAPEEPVDDDYDEDFDPNDIVQGANEATPHKGGDDDSDTDYGSDY
ncbi:hypothetical protein D9756_010269 [Leucocoprinus leucothites]|uniref:Uncharacterized protein n=1 Tax=Leucocoprinus leucothites TaxID=201217 RepID=A0A8H5CTP0_9AGAR|nr:hypothetical protein D9756_010269 [Leucoagaricus leucothites]